MSHTPWTIADDDGRPVALVVAEHEWSIDCVPHSRPTATPIPMPIYDRMWDLFDFDMPADLDPEEAEAHRSRWLRAWGAVLHERMPGFGRHDERAYRLYREWHDSTADDEIEAEALAASDADWDRWRADPARLAALDEAMGEVMAPPL